MAKKPNDKTQKKIRTGSVERRAVMARAGVLSSSRMAGSAMLGIFQGKEARQARRRKALSKEARFMVEEMGKLKGSVVKIGQMMALYGEHFLPEEINDALHSLESETPALTWATMEGELKARLPNDCYTQFSIDQTPIGCASLGQVYVAEHNDETWCLKVQYPGVAQAIDSDLKAMTQLLVMAKAVPKGPRFDEWLEEIRLMLHHEVDYQREADATRRMQQRISGDGRYVVPTVLDKASTKDLLVTSYEHGLHPLDEQVLALSQTRRNALAEAFFEFFLQEFFVWGELQTDPNFGNYRIRIADDDKNDVDQVVMLDFGATRQFNPAFLSAFYQLMQAALQRDLQGVIAAATTMEFLRPDMPRDVADGFAEVCCLVMEPFRGPDDVDSDTPKEAFNAEGKYCWGKSNLPKRASAMMGRAALSRYFKIPPAEFLFLNRKLVGVYTFMAVMDAESDMRGEMAKYLARLN